MENDAYAMVTLFMSSSIVLLFKFGFQFVYGTVVYNRYVMLSKVRSSRTFVLVYSSTL